ncbi:MAG: ABC transporter ATP-binding protein [Acidimicrobiales bacterium]
MAALAVDRLVVRYGKRTAVDGITFSAEPGTVLALLGPNGAGKTSTVEVLEGYHRPAAGTVRVLGLDPVADRAAVVSRIGVMLQRGGVYPTMPAGAVLRLFASYYADPLPPEELLDRLDLRSVARTPWRRLSGGEQQRLSLALAMVGRPEVAFLDEPSAGMDPAARRLLWDVIRGLRDGGAAVLLTTHDLEEAERLADHVVIVDRGRIVAEGPPAELARSGAAADIRFGAVAGLDTAALGRAVGGVVVEEGAGEYLVAVPATPANVARLTAWLAEQDVAVGDIRAGRQRLEDVFLRLTGQPSAAEEDRAPRVRRRRGAA